MWEREREIERQLIVRVIRWTRERWFSGIDDVAMRYIQVVVWIGSIEDELIRTGTRILIVFCDMIDWRNYEQNVLMILCERS